VTIPVPEATFILTALEVTVKAPLVVADTAEKFGTATQVEFAAVTKQGSSIVYSMVNVAVPDRDASKDTLNGF
jgi:hypothetical protein